MEKSIFRFILRYSKRQQVYILFVTLASLPFYYASLDIPKKIVNGTLTAASDTFPRALDVFGYEVARLDRLPLLAVLSGTFLFLVVINGAFKYYINVFKGLLGERMLRRLRYQLFSRILRFPLPSFRRIAPGALIPMITAEVEPLGGFVGDAVALPLHQGGLLVTAVFFIFVQDLWMGLAAVSLYPIQGYVIPRLQRQVNLLAKKRVREVRRLSERISETTQTVQEIHASAAVRYEMARFTYRLGRIFDIRYQIYRKKFFIKFLNNFMNHLTPFFFYSIGGYLVINGEVSLGALVAVLAAYKDLPGPWRELLNYYQTKEDSRIKYEQVIAQFAPPEMVDETLLVTMPDPVPRLEGEVAVRRVSYAVDEVRLIEGASFAFTMPMTVAIVGAGGSGKAVLAMLLAGLIVPTSGRITIGGNDLKGLPEPVRGRRIAFVGPNAVLIAGTIRDNLVYGLYQRPVSPPPDDEHSRQARAEAAVTDNSLDDVTAQWVDWKSIGVEGEEQELAACIHALTVAGMVDDVYALGLRCTIDPSEKPDVAQHIIEARAVLRHRLEEHGMADLIEPFDRDAYTLNATLAENLLFGTPVGDAFDMEHLADNDYVRWVLDHCGLTEEMLERGYDVAQTMVELFADLPPDHELFEQFSFVSADDLATLKALVTRVGRADLGALKEDERRLLLSLPFKLVPARHRLDIIDEALQARLLGARRVFAENLPAHLAGAVEFFDRERYNAAATVLDNVLFGKLAYGRAGAADRVRALVTEVIDALDLRVSVIAAGLGFQVGPGGARLSAGERQKLAIARGVLKRPDMMILSEATSLLDGAAHNRIQTALVEELSGRTLVWALHRPSLARAFARLVVVAGGRVVATGAYADIEGGDDAFARLVAAE